MITNERQYKITRSQLARLKKALAEASDELDASGMKRSRLDVAQLDALQSECDVLANQVRDYEVLKSGAVTVFRAESLEQLPELLICARIAQGLSQKDLAENLKLKEQQIQRYESENYRSASLRRLIDVANALDLSISEVGEIHARPTSFDSCG